MKGLMTPNDSTNDRNTMRRIILGYNYTSKIKTRIKDKIWWIEKECYVWSMIKTIRTCNMQRIIYNFLTSFPSKESKPHYIIASNILFQT